MNLYFHNFNVKSLHFIYLEWCHLVLAANIPVLLTGSTFPKLPYVFFEQEINLLLSDILNKNYINQQFLILRSITDLNLWSILWWLCKISDWKPVPIGWRVIWGEWLLFHANMEIRSQFISIPMVIRKKKPSSFTY